ncbi:MAG: repeat protein [Planctomycetaceae bacterium]|nr:repeat protein [Planctomycetaceae bacterium]
MSRHNSHSDSWYDSVGRWLSGAPKRKRHSEETPTRQVTVEFLENRQLLSATNTSGANPTDLNSASSDEQTAAVAGSSSTTTTTHGVDSNGNPTTTTTITTTTTDNDGNTTTSSTSTTTVDGTTTTPSTSIDTDQALGMALQADGKMILVGAVQIDTYGNYDFGITRLNADGSLDTSFGTNGKKVISFDLGGRDADDHLSMDQDVATCVAIQSDGKIVVGGYAQRDGFGNFDFAVVRLNTDGALDTTFSSDGKAVVAFDYGGGGDDRATGIALQDDGKIVLVGYCQKQQLGDNDIALARLKTDGSLDTSFTGDGRKFIGFNSSGNGDDRGAAVKIQADGRIVVVGYAQAGGTGNDDFAIARVTTGGSLDYSFSGDGKKTVGFDLGGTGNDRATSVAIQTDGGIVVAGSASSVDGDGDFGVVRIKKNGSIDKTFSGDGKKTIPFNLGADLEDQATGVAIQADGSIVLSGLTQISATGDFDFAAARLTTAGELDTSFSTDGKKSIAFNMGGSDNDVANGVVLQSDGKILLFGHALRTDPANTDFAVARLDTDGQLDTSFGTGGLKTIPFDET